jgi:aspartate aminotransferase
MIANIYYTYTKQPKNRRAATFAASGAAKKLPADKNPINLTLGELDISPSEADLANWRAGAAQRAEAEPLYKLTPTGGKGRNYPPGIGTESFRKVAAYIFSRDSGIEDVSAGDVIVGAGGKGILNGLGSSFAPGDQVLVAAPGWPTNYDFWRDGVQVVEADTNGRGLMTPDELRLSLHDHPGIKAVLINDPSNPTGARYDAAEREEIMKVLNEARGHNPSLVAIMDDPYGALNYDGTTLLRGEQEKKLFNDGGMAVVNSVSKVYGAPDLRVGYVVSKNKALLEQVELYNTNPQTVATVRDQNDAQLMLLFGDKFREETKGRMAARAQLLSELVKDIPGIKANTPKGAIYGWLDCSGLKGKVCPAELTLDKKEIVIDSPSKVTEFFRQAALVGMVNGDSFYAPRADETGKKTVEDKAWYARVVLGDEAILRTAFERIAKAVGQLQEPQRQWAASLPRSAAAGATPAL